MANTKELREKRAELVSQARQLFNEHESEWGGEYEQKFDAMMADSDALKDKIDKLERLEGMEYEINAQSEPTRDPREFVADPAEKPDGRKESEIPQSEKLVPYRRGSVDGRPHYVYAKPEKRGCKEYSDAWAAYCALQESPQQFATLQSDSDPDGGYLTASEQFAAQLLKEVDDLLFIRQFATVHTSVTADSLGIRKRTARMSSFAYSSECLVSDEDTSLKFGKKVLTPHHLTGSIDVSRDLLRRSVMSAEAIVLDEMARDAGEVMEDKFLLGTGVNEPLGVFVASSDGISTARDVTAGTTTAITADGLIDTKYALKSQYRTGTRSAPRWLLSREAVKQIRKLKDAEDQYLWQTGLQFGQPDILLGYPVDESERVPNTFTTGLYVGLLAVWRWYEIADSLDMEFQRLVELKARTNKVEWIGRLKNDGMPTLEEAFVRMQLA